MHFLSHFVFALSLLHFDKKLLVLLLSLVFDHLAGAGGVKKHRECFAALLLWIWSARKIENSSRKLTQAAQDRHLLIVGRTTFLPAGTNSSDCHELTKSPEVRA